MGCGFEMARGAGAESTGVLGVGAEGVGIAVVVGTLGPLARRFAIKAAAAEAARAKPLAVLVPRGADAASAGAVTPVRVDAGVVAVCDAATKVVAVFVLVATTVCVLSALLEASLEITAVGVTLPAVVCGLDGPRRNMNAAPAATKTPTLVAMIRLLEDLPVADGLSNGEGIVCIGPSAATLLCLRAVFSFAAIGSVEENCVGANCVLGPYSESLYALGGRVGSSADKAADVAAAPSVTPAVMIVPIGAPIATMVDSPGLRSCVVS